MKTEALIAHQNRQSQILDRIEAYPDFHELLSEATAEPYPIHGELRIKRVKESVAGIREAILAADDAEAGRLLRSLVIAQIEEWQS